jgi:ribosome-associated protein
LKAHDPRSLELVRLCCRALDSKKAGDLRVLDVRGHSSITDYLVIATATSEPHVRALRVELEKALDLAKTRILGFETAQESGWAVMDAFDVMVHIFTPERRARYSLESLWRDGREVALEAVLLDGKKPAKKAARARKAAPRKKSVRRK